MTRIVDVKGCDNPSLLRSKQVLHINYPPLASDDINGVRLAKQGHLVARRLANVRNEDGEYDFQYMSENAADSESGDTTLFNNGFITIVPIDGEFTATPRFDIEVKPGVQIRPFD